MPKHSLTRRTALTLGAASLLCPRPALASAYREITWDDLVPPGVPYSEIIGEGDMDEMNDKWKPIFDANGIKMNDALNGKRIKMPGYIVPLEQTTEGIMIFILAPYQGACVHVPPPPPNQLVLVYSNDPWPIDKAQYAIWVYGTLKTHLLSTTLADIGYRLDADKMEIYQW